MNYPPTAEKTQQKKQQGRKTRRSNPPPPLYLSGDAVIDEHEKLVTSNTVKITDQQKVENLLSEKSLTCEYELRNGTLRFKGVSGFTVYEKKNGTWQKYGGLGSLLHELRPFLEEGEELIIQSVRGDAHNFPIGAYQFKATPDAVHYSDLETGEEEVEVADQ